MNKFGKYYINKCHKDCSINSDDKNVRYKMDFYILYRLLSVAIILFMISIICYHDAKHRSKQKNIDTLTI